MLTILICDVGNCYGNIKSRVNVNHITFLTFIQKTLNSGQFTSFLTFDFDSIFQRFVIDCIEKFEAKKKMKYIGHTQFFCLSFVSCVLFYDTKYLSCHASSWEQVGRKN
jgi:hypothetical protein